MIHFSSKAFQRKYNDRMMSEEQVETGTLVEAGGKCRTEWLPGQSGWLTGIDHKKRHLFFSSFPMSAGVGIAVHVPLEHVVKSACPGCTVFVSGWDISWHAVCCYPALCSNFLASMVFVLELNLTWSWWLEVWHFPWYISYRNLPRYQKVKSHGLYCQKYSGSLQCF